MKKIFLIKASILCVFLFALPCFLNAQPVACYPLDGSIGDVITGHQGGFSPGTYTVPDRFGNAIGAVVTNNGTMLGGVNLGNYSYLAYFLLGEVLARVGGVVLGLLLWLDEVC